MLFPSPRPSSQVLVPTHELAHNAHLAILVAKESKEPSTLLEVLPTGRGDSFPSPLSSGGRGGGFRQGCHAAASNLGWCLHSVQTHL